MAAESMLASSSTPSVLSTQSDEDASRTAAGEFRRSLLEAYVPITVTFWPQAHPMRNPISTRSRPPADSSASQPPDAVLERLRERGDDLDRPLRDLVVGLSDHRFTLFEDAGLVTLGDAVMALYSGDATPLDIDGVGRKTVSTLRNVIDTIVEHGIDGHLYGPGAAPQSIQDMLAHVLDALGDHRELVEQRFWGCRTYAEIGRELGLTTQRIQQCVDAIPERTRRFRVDVERFIRPLLAALDKHQIIAFEDLYALGFEAPAEALLLVEVADAGPLYALEGRFLSSLSARELASVAPRIREQLRRVGETFLDWTRVDAVVQNVVGASWPRDVLRIWFDDDSIIMPVEDGIKVRRSRRARVQRVLLDADGPLTVADIAERMVHDDPDLDVDYERERIRRNQILAYPEFLRVGHKEYLHVEHSPWPDDAVQRFVDRCLEFLRDRPDAVSADYLLKELGGPELQDMTWHTAKGLLSNQAEIKSLGSSHQVAWAETYDPDVSSLFHHVETILAEAETSLRLEDVEKRLVTVDFHEMGISKALTGASFSVRVGWGRYAHRDKIEMSSQAIRRLRDTAFEYLSVANAPADAASLYEALVDREPGVRVRCALSDVQPTELFMALLELDPRFEIASWSDGVVECVDEST